MTKLLPQTAASYLPQHPWLRQATIRDNIVGHHAPFHKTHYDVTLRTCCLTSDLQDMAAGDLTEVGDKVAVKYSFILSCDEGRVVIYYNTSMGPD